MKHRNDSIQRARNIRLEQRLLVLQALAMIHGTDCLRCGRPVDIELMGWPDGASIDHVDPIALGGPNAIDNVRLAHYECNTQHGVRRATVNGRTGTPSRMARWRDAPQSTLFP